MIAFRTCRDGFFCDHDCASGCARELPALPVTTQHDQDLRFGGAVAHPIWTVQGAWKDGTRIVYGRREEAAARETFHALIGSSNIEWLELVTPGCEVAASWPSAFLRVAP